VAELTGVLQADFSAFYKAVTTAETHLRDFETGAGQVEKSLNRMVDAFSGRKLIQDATYAAQAIERLGGASKLTEKELHAAAAQAAEAAEKLRALGKEVPPEIDKLAHAVREVGEETAQVTIKTGGLSDQYRQFDGVLNAVGINLGQQVKAIEDIKNAAGGGAQGLSLFAKAGLIAGAAMVGWEIGKKIEEWTGRGAARGKAPAAALGWTEAAGGAGSASDTMRRASALAGREITNFAEAQKYLEDRIKSNQATMSRAVADEQLTGMVKKWRAELDGLSKGELASLTRHLEAGIIPQKELLRYYHLSAEALELLSDKLALNSKANAAATASYQQFVNLQRQMFGTDLIAKAHDYALALGNVSNVSKLLPDQATAMQRTWTEAAAQLERLGKAGGDAHTEFLRLAAATTPLPDLFSKVTVGAAGLADILPKVTINWQEEAKAINAANAALREVEPVLQQTTPAVTQQTEAVRALAASFTVVSKSAQEWRAQAELLRMDAERMEKSGGGLSTTMWQGQYIENLRTGAARAEASAFRQEQLEGRIAGRGMPWGGGGGGWTVNVNAMQGINGDQIAEELVAGMRRRGVSPGGF
jgi:hypothetical protein